MRKTLLMAAFAILALAACGQNKKEKTVDDAATVHITTESFKEKVYDFAASPKTFEYKGELPAIVDFYATWCRPCQILSPVLEELAEEYAGKVVIYKVDVDESKELASVFGIRSIPTLLFIPGKGESPSMSTGAPSKEELKEWIEKVIKK